MPYLTASTVWEERCFWVLKNLCRLVHSVINHLADSRVPDRVRLMLKNELLSLYLFLICFIISVTVR